MGRFDSVVGWNVAYRLGGKVTGLVWFKADDKCNQVKRPAEACNPDIILKRPAGCDSQVSDKITNVAAAHISLIWKIPLMEAGTEDIYLKRIRDKFDIFDQVLGSHSSE